MSRCMAMAGGIVCMASEEEAPPGTRQMRRPRVRAMVTCCEEKEECSRRRDDDDTTKYLGEHGLGACMDGPCERVRQLLQHHELCPARIARHCLGPCRHRRFFRCSSEQEQERVLSYRSLLVFAGVLGKEKRILTIERRENDRNP